MNLIRTFAAVRAVYNKKTGRKYKVGDLANKASRHLDRAPKRRCSSHTFRYGYLVTT